MKKILYLLPFLGAAFPLRGQSPATHEGFEKLKTIAGKWKGTVHSPMGPSGVTLEWEEISGGRALMEKLTFDGAPTMVSIYHPDGRQLMMTHYCTSANQPRVRTRQTEWSAASRDFEFFYLDATNVLSSDQMHIEKLTFNLKDDDHLVQKWSDGKMEVVLTMERVSGPPGSPAPGPAPPSPGPR